MRTCKDCGRELIALRRPTRTTYYCALKDEPSHREARRLRLYREQTARIEAIINRRES